MDKVFELFDDELLIINHTFHHVANRHDADHALILEHREMAHGSRSHDGHAFFH